MVNAQERVKEHGADLERIFEEDAVKDTSEQRQAPETVMAELVALAKELKEKKDELKRREEEDKITQQRVDEIRFTLLPERMRAAGLVDDATGKGKFTAGGVGTVFLQTRTFASIPEEKREAAFEFLRENGAQALIKETVHAGTLASWVSEVRAAGEIALPGQDVIKVFDRTEAAIRKA